MPRLPKNLESLKNLEFEKLKKKTRILNKNRYKTLNFKQKSIKNLKKPGILSNFYMLRNFRFDTKNL